MSCIKSHDHPILISIRMVKELFLLLHRNFGITYRRILNLQTQLMILNANLKQFFLCELMNRDVFVFYLLCTFIYFVVSVWFQLIFVNSAFESCRKGAI